jgi:hypothetical protein
MLAVTARGDGGDRYAVNGLSWKETVLPPVRKAWDR